MQIAPDFDSSEWARLELDDPISKDWEKAICVFNSRFIEPADVLVSIDENKAPTERRYEGGRLGQTQIEAKASPTNRATANAKPKPWSCGLVATPS